jgi:hypothetical protein
MTTDLVIGSWTMAAILDLRRAWPARTPVPRFPSRLTGNGFEVRSAGAAG